MNESRKSDVISVFSRKETFRHLGLAIQMEFSGYGREQPDMQLLAFSTDHQVPHSCESTALDTH